ncbi:chemotaxis protein [Geothermobacter hydrogeniphilus]|uniref:Chemotaxis protein n=1 Tax=Geothermobacter hydrogeniphilus TaxID=1969733 RepID=A0A1X0YE61_9BACT|nr:chemotaxis protein [Geothermobacter hydrogeniphilus]ORJ63470.1 chemotaxis protein [Geothermobacter hydrogeniphilus]
MLPTRFALRPTVLAALCLCLLLSAGTARAAELSPLDQKAKKLARQCADKITRQFDLLLTSGRLTLPQLFDTFYIPIPGTDPQKFHTQYDRLTDGVLLPILDSCLAADKRFIFVVAVDRNGYLPTHNSKYSQPMTGDGDHDTKWNRTKRIFNDRTGLAAARNIKPYLLQRYSRDTGEVMTDLSVPVWIQGRHWGAVRIGYMKQ